MKDSNINLQLLKAGQGGEYSEWKFCNLIATQESESNKRTKQKKKKKSIKKKKMKKKKKRKKKRRRRRTCCKRGATKNYLKFSQTKVNWYDEKMR
jgi:hypothetical protein